MATEEVSPCFLEGAYPHDPGEKGPSVLSGLCLPQPRESVYGAGAAAGVCVVLPLTATRLTVRPAQKTADDQAGRPPPKAAGSLPRLMASGWSVLDS